jgi:hypothetical protein
MKRLLGIGAAAAALTYFFDPENGSRRRNVARDRVLALIRQATHMREQSKAQPDDVTLARKVESQIFRDADLPKGKINVNAENGKVVLRGEVEDPSMIEDLEKAARKVLGVREVENLLHAAGSPAPTSSS